MDDLKKIKKINLFLVVVLFLSLNLVTITLSKYISTVNKQARLVINRPTYTVYFHSNNGLDNEVTQNFSYGIGQSLTANTFTYSGKYFSHWNTASDDSGTSYDNEEIVDKLTNVNNGHVDLYAIWVSGIAEINGTPYTSLQTAINDVSLEHELTTVRLLASTTEHVTTYAGQEIILDLGNYTLSNSLNNAPVIENAGTLYISNGNIESGATKAGTVNNRNGGILTISGGRIINTGERQAVFNDASTLTIEGNAYLYASGSERSALQNQKNSSTTITGGTIISIGTAAVTNSGTMTIGTKNDDANSSILIRGITYGVTSGTNISFYDGLVEGKDGGFNDDRKITSREEGFLIVHGTEMVGNEPYDKVYLGLGNTITFKGNGGTPDEASKVVVSGTAIGSFPNVSRSEYTFVGWFTEASGGTEITVNDIIERDITVYAHWQLSNSRVAKIGDVYYDTLQSAIDACPSSTETTIELQQDISAGVKVASVKRIILDLNGYTISNADDVTIIENNGRLEIKNGTITSDAEHACIDSLSGSLLLNGITVTATGSRQALYASGGTITIDNHSYMSSNSFGVPTSGTLRRGTIYVQASATVIVKSATIVMNNDHNAISNSGTLTLGVDDGTIDNSSIELISNGYGIETDGTFNLYDGVIKGVGPAVQGTVTSTAPNTDIIYDTEVIDNVTYNTEYLQLQE